jgi:hypothetical protein
MLSPEQSVEPTLSTRNLSNQKKDRDSVDKSVLLVSIRNSHCRLGAFYYSEGLDSVALIPLLLLDTCL